MGKKQGYGQTTQTSPQGPSGPQQGAPRYTQPRGNAAVQQQLAAQPSAPSTDDILRDYQVQDDTMTQYTPFGAGLFMDPKEMTQTEADLLGELQFHQGLMGLLSFKGAHDDAFEASEDRYNGQGSWAGHQDAFRHMYWNALMVRELGPEFAEAFATAHEGRPGNMADDEAMDLYNNSIGRQIALANPDASLEELQELIQEAVTNGQAVVIDANGELVFSDAVAVGATGRPDDAPVSSTNAPPEWERY